MLPDWREIHGYSVAGDGGRDQCETDYDTFRAYFETMNSYSDQAMVLLSGAMSWARVDEVTSYTVEDNGGYGVEIGDSDLSLYLCTGPERGNWQRDTNGSGGVCVVEPVPCVEGGLNATEVTCSFYNDGGTLEVHFYHVW